MIQNGNKNVKNACHLMFNLKEFVYLNERLCYEDGSDNSEELEMNENNKMLMKKDEERLMM